MKIMEKRKEKKKVSSTPFSLPPSLPLYLLWNHSQPTPQRRQLQRARVHTINDDLAPFLRLDQAEKGEKKGALPAAGSADHSYFRP